ncbi:MAG: hypothetical protein ACKPE1_06105 [Dolichospermum sp.]
MCQFTNHVDFNVNNSLMSILATEVALDNLRIFGYYVLEMQKY